MHYLTFKFYIIFLKIIILHFLTHSMDLRLVKKKKQELESTSITPRDWSNDFQTSCNYEM